MYQAILFTARNMMFVLKNPRRYSIVIRSMRMYKKEHPFCECCGGTEGVEVHHIKPVHLFPELAADIHNFGCACRPNKCHLVVGHFNDFKNKYNVNFGVCAAAMLQGLRRNT